ncbi:hypothetical protein EV356DRAFT_495573 [Viridothelium virens]|uniref:RBR-type E3 ubiquitin transferase n=1 Tax=Viridothelium virens TaxID=1048519 RepID=A0A6A6HNS8_VIRVR|nr:hypothetical protein EV356DRAFT_495573 [Viridothelium virens]
MARVPRPRSAVTPHRGLNSKATRRSSPQSVKSLGKTDQDQTSRYGLRKRRRSPDASNVQERPTKARRSPAQLPEKHSVTPKSSIKDTSKASGGVEGPPKPSPRTYNCRICLEDVVTSRFPRKNACPESCVDCLTGENRICKPCIVSSIIAQSEIRDIDKVGCPSCYEPWEYRRLVSFLPRDEVRRLDARIIARGVAKEENWRWCPQRGCQFGQIYDVNFGSNPVPEWCTLYICQGCHRHNCFKHQTPWHENLSCAQYDYRQEHERVKEGGKTNEELEEQDRESRLLMQKQETRICPYCGHAVQRTVGCDSMQCKSNSRPETI